MSDDKTKLIIICVVGYLLLKRTGVRPQTGVRVPQQNNNKNVQGAVWASLLGDSWKKLASAAYPKNAAGQCVTSDGKPTDANQFPTWENAGGDDSVPDINDDNYMTYL